MKVKICDFCIMKEFDFRELSDDGEPDLSGYAKLWNGGKLVLSKYKIGWRGSSRRYDCLLDACEEHQDEVKKVGSKDKWDEIAFRINRIFEKNTRRESI